jgi:hypothetical protein
MQRWPKNLPAEQAEENEEQDAVSEDRVCARDHGEMDEQAKDKPD